MDVVGVAFDVADDDEEDDVDEADAARLSCVIIVDREVREVNTWEDVSDVSRTLRIEERERRLFVFLGSTLRLPLPESSTNDFLGDDIMMMNKITHRISRNDSIVRNVAFEDGL